MFKKLIVAYTMLVMMGVGTGAMTRLAESAPVVQTAGAPHTPSAPVVPAQGSVPATPLSAPQMSEARGGLFGFLKKIWKKIKKNIIKILWTIIKEIVEIIITESTQQVNTHDGEIVEVYEGSEEIADVYASQTDYDANNVQSSSYVDYGYNYSYSYGGGGEY
jgi:hypothetical protein